MIGGLPPRPTGRSPAANFFQWVWDQLAGQNAVREVPGALVSRTSRGTVVQPLGTTRSGSGARVAQYLLRDASKPDYFICRTLGNRVEDPEAETPVILPAIGREDIFIAKAFHLRQTPFDRAVLNAADPSLIGKLDEITYDIEVDSWNGATLDVQTRKISYEYKSATYRIATDQTDQTDDVDNTTGDPPPDQIGDNWVTERQTIIPRFVPAELVEPVDPDEPVTTATQGATIIYAVTCPNLESLITDEDDGDVPPRLLAQAMRTDVADGEVSINLLALNDGWAWARTI
jgi:hypothetical protein